MASRDEIRRAKRSDGICVESTCGSRALYPYEHCGKHIPPSQPVAYWVARREQKKMGDDQPPPQNRHDSLPGSPPIPANGKLIFRQFWVLNGRTTAEVWVEMKTREDRPGQPQIGVWGSQYYDAQRGIVLFSDLAGEMTVPSLSRVFRIRQVEVFESLTER